ncbi:MAG: hypothetical protein P8Q92_11775 [Pseudoprimorskyibacter sp.]|nr:hypothetical protein [Pseudoprimorskyibacter sp.]
MPFSSLALTEYLDAFARVETIHASIDIDHDNADTGRELAMPALALWATHGVSDTCFDALDLWRQRAEKVEGKALDASHYMAEEIPDQIAAHMFAFFARHPIYTKAAGLFRS